MNTLLALALYNAVTSVLFSLAWGLLHLAGEAALHGLGIPGDVLRALFKIGMAITGALALVFMIWSSLIQP